MLNLKHTSLSAFSCFLLAAVFTAVASADASRFDGPAELPRVTVKSALADTPAPGQSRLIKEGDNLQQAINTASCGDTLRLQAGATFTGVFSFPAKPCDDQHWIIIRTDAADSSVPPEGSRLTPCYAGVASLPGRPAYPCSAPKNVLARLVFDGKAGSGPIRLEWGANHYRFLGLEITRGAPGANIANLAFFRNAGQRADGTVDWNSKGDHVIFDRVWIHGNEKDETTRGVELGGSTDVAVVDSYFSDLKCIALTGACTDAQAIAGGAGDNPMGPYKIENNFLEASGECVMFGGGAGSATPADIEIRHNHLFRPILWKSDEPGFMPASSGKPFIVKNIFELKNAQRVLFEGNILENIWGGFTQTGFAILLTPKSQGANLCPQCRVTDITIRYSKISHCASGFEIANVQSAGNGIATAGERYSVHDVVIDDIDPVRYKGYGILLQFISTQPPLRDIKIDHITGFSPKILFNIGVLPPSPKIATLTLTNNLIGAGERDVTSTGGGPVNCAYQAQRLGAENMFDLCFSHPTVARNVVVNANGSWPKDNFTPKNMTDAGLASEKSTIRDFRLCREKNEAAGCKKASPYLQSGTDGKPVGADIDAINAATAGVE
jgi:hypothetical protein